MHHNYQQLDLETLIDLLAEEAQKYTRAFICGNLKEVDQQSIIIDSLIEEINSRKRGLRLEHLKSQYLVEVRKFVEALGNNASQQELIAIRNNAMKVFDEIKRNAEMGKT